MFEFVLSMAAFLCWCSRNCAGNVSVSVLSDSMRPHSHTGTSKVEWYLRYFCLSQCSKCKNITVCGVECTPVVLNAIFSRNNSLEHQVRAD